MVGRGKEEKREEAGMRREEGKGRDSPPPKKSELDLPVWWELAPLLLVGIDGPPYTHSYIPVNAV